VIAFVHPPPAPRRHAPAETPGRNFFRAHSITRRSSLQLRLENSPPHTDVVRGKVSEARLSASAIVGLCGSGRMDELNRPLTFEIWGGWRLDPKPMPATDHRKAEAGMVVRRLGRTERGRTLSERATLGRGSGSVVGSGEGAWAGQHQHTHFTLVFTPR